MWCTLTRDEEMSRHRAPGMKPASELIRDDRTHTVTKDRERRVKIICESYDKRVAECIRSGEGRLAKALVASRQLDRTDLYLGRKIRPVSIDRGAPAGIRKAK